MCVKYWCVVCFFKQKTAYDMRISDWSSDVCSSDLSSSEEIQVPHGAAIGGRDQRGVGAQRGRHGTVALGWPVSATGLEPLAPLLQGRPVHLERDAAPRDVDGDAVAVLHQRDRPAGGGLGRHVADREARAATGEAPVGDERPGRDEAAAREEGGGVEHYVRERGGEGNGV